MYKQYKKAQIFCDRKKIIGMNIKYVKSILNKTSYLVNNI